MSVNVGNAVAYIDLDASKFTSGLSKIGKDFGQFMDKTESAGNRITGLGEGLKKVGSSLTKNVTVPFVALGTTVSKFAIDTEQSMAKVNSILKLSESDFEEYEKTLKKGANEIGLAYDKYAESAYNAISAGVEQAEVTNFLTDANKLAKGGLTDLAKATDVLTTVQNAYGLSQKDMAKVSDVLIQTQNKGKTTVDELASSMGKIIPTANSLGVSVEQLGAGYAILTAKGIATAEATTYMNSMFNELGKSGTKVDKALREISGKSFKELSESGKTTGDILKMLDDYAKKSGLSLTDLFGSAEAGKSALTLLSDGVEGFNGMLDEMKNSTGATNDAFNEMNGTMKESLVQSMERLKNAMSDLGTAFAPVVSFIAELITSLANWIMKMQETHPQILNIILVVTGLVSAIGPLLMLVGSIITILPVLGAGFAFLSGPIGLVIAIITLLIATGKYLYDNWDYLKESAIVLWNQIKDTITTVGETIKAFLEASWEGIKTFLSTCWEGIKTIASTVWEGIKFVIETYINMVKAYIESVWNFIKLITTTIWNGIKLVITTVWNGIKSVVTTAINIVKTTIETVFNAIKTFITTVWNGIKTAINTVWNGIKSVVQTGANAVKTVVTTVFGTLEAILTAPFKSAQKVISSILGGISKAINTVTSGIKKVTGMFKSVPGPQLPQEPSHDVYSQDNNDYTKVRFNYAKASQVSMSDVIASNYSMLDTFKDFTKGVKLDSKQSDVKTDNTINVSLNIDKFINESKQSVDELMDEITFKLKRKSFI